jgi:hypothetical protein
MVPRRSAQPPQPPDVRQFRTAAEIDATITRLKRRVADIEKVRIDNVRHDDARVDNVEHAREVLHMCKLVSDGGHHGKVSLSVTAQH